MQTIHLVFMISTIIFLLGCNEDEKPVLNILFQNQSNSTVDSIKIGFDISDTANVHSPTKVGAIQKGEEYSFRWEVDYPWSEGGYQVNVYLENDNMLSSRFGYFTGFSDNINLYTIAINDTTLSITH
jgi:hypothetical protein